MAGFKLLKSSQEPDVIFVNVNATSVAVGDLLFNSIGSTAWSKAPSASINVFHLKCVAGQANTAGTDKADLNCTLVQPGQIWEAETANNSAVAHNGDRMVLTDENMIDNTGTDATGVTAVFLQLYTLGAAADLRIAGVIATGEGFNPNAT